MTEPSRPSARSTLQKGGYVGQSVPRKEDRRLVQGQGVFFDDVKRHGMGYVHFVRSPYAHAKIVSIDVSAALALDGRLRDADRRRGRDPDRSVLPDRRSPPGSQIKDYALAVGKVRYIGEPVVAVVRRDARARARRGRARRGRVRAARRRSSTRAEALEDDAPVLHDEAGTNVVWSGVFDWGDVDARARRGRPRREDQGAPLPPLLLDAARVLRRARRVQPRHRAVDDPLQQPVARLRARSGWRRRCASGSTSSASSPRTSAAASATRSPRTRSYVALLPARAQARTARSSGRSGAPTSHLSNVARQRALVPRHRGRGARPTGR